MLELLEICIPIAIVLIVLKTEKDKRDRTKKQNQPGANRQPLPPKGAARAPAVGQSGDKAYLLMDDRKNDWLAKQLEEEERAERRIRYMFNLKYDAKRDHEKHCEAAQIKSYHEKNCDASGVDTAKGK